MNKADYEQTNEMRKGMQTQRTCFKYIIFKNNRLATNLAFQPCPSLAILFYFLLLS